MYPLLRTLILEQKEREITDSKGCARRNVEGTKNVTCRWGS